VILLKSESQVNKIREASRVVSETLDLLERKIKPGVTTLTLDKEAAEFIKSRGARASFKGYRGFPANICTSINEELVHAIPSKRALRETDIISIDVGIELDGYYSDAARTFAVTDKIPEVGRRLIEVTRRALEIGIEEAKVGNRLFDISYSIQNFAERENFSVVRQFVGHGVGLAIHEDPQIPNFGKPDTGIKLKPGMVLALEPMLNAGDYRVEVLDDGWTAVTCDRKLCAHFEDTIYIGKDKTEVLTK
jgi:methionyl aminopeptidase